MKLHISFLILSVLTSCKSRNQTDTAEIKGNPLSQSSVSCAIKNNEEYLAAIQSTWVNRPFDMNHRITFENTTNRAILSLQGGEAVTMDCSDDPTKNAMAKCKGDDNRGVQYTVALLRKNEKLIAQITKRGDPSKVILPCSGRISSSFE